MNQLKESESEQSDEFMDLSLQDRIYLKLFQKDPRKNNQNRVLITDRIWAILIDVIVLFLLNSLLGLGILMYSVDSEFSEIISTISVLNLVISFYRNPYFMITGCLYFALMESNRTCQGTIGKLILKLKVVRMNGQKLSFGDSVGRFFIRLVTSAFFMLDYVWCIFQKDRRCLHDLAVGSIVVYRRGTT
jgi:uncharacterized RDD family membrane protein YckC